MLLGGKKKCHICLHSICSCNYILKILWCELKMDIVQADALNLLVAQGLRTQSTANVQGTAQDCERTEKSK